MIKHLKASGCAEAEVLEGHKCLIWSSLDYSQAAQHFSVAAAKGNAEGMYNLVALSLPPLLPLSTHLLLSSLFAHPANIFAAHTHRESSTCMVRECAKIWGWLSTSYKRPPSSHPFAIWGPALWVRAKPADSELTYTRCGRGSTCAGKMLPGGTRGNQERIRGTAADASVG